MTLVIGLHRDRKSKVDIQVPSLSLFIEHIHLRRHHSTLLRSRGSQKDPDSAQTESMRQRHQPSIDQVWKQRQNMMVSEITAKARRRRVVGFYPAAAANILLHL